MDASDKLEEIFRHFPGIGPRQARRFVYYLLTQNQSELSQFSNLLLELKSSIAVCPQCFRFFPLRQFKPDPAVLCSICSDQNRDQSQLMITARDIDLQAIEKSRAYSGTYFVLGGTVPILDPDPAGHIRQAELLAYISNREKANQPISEIIIATSVNPESEYTATYLTGVIKKLYESANTGTAPDSGSDNAIMSNKKIPRITTLGRGLSTGTELEYSDSDTLRSALENRR